MRAAAAANHGGVAPEVKIRRRGVGPPAIAQSFVRRFIRGREEEAREGQPEVGEEGGAEEREGGAKGPRAGSKARAQGVLNARSPAVLRRGFFRFAPSGPG